MAGFVSAQISTEQLLALQGVFQKLKDLDKYAIGDGRLAIVHRKDLANMITLFDSCLDGIQSDNNLSNIDRTYDWYKESSKDASSDSNEDPYNKYQQMRQQVLEQVKHHPDTFADAQKQLNDSLAADQQDNVLSTNKVNTMINNLHEIEKSKQDAEATNQDSENVASDQQGSMGTDEGDSMNGNHDYEPDAKDHVEQSDKDSEADLDNLDAATDKFMNDNQALIENTLNGSGIADGKEAKSKPTATDNDTDKQDHADNSNDETHDSSSVDANEDADSDENVQSASAADGTTVNSDSTNDDTDHSNEKSADDEPASPDDLFNPGDADNDSSESDDGDDDGFDLAAAVGLDNN